MQHVLRGIALALRGRSLTVALKGQSLTIALAIAGGIALAGCDSQSDPFRNRASTPETPVEPAQESQPATGSEGQTEAIATIQAIVANPVSVTLGQGEPEPAQINQTMAYGDQIRTADQALAEVGLVNGAMFRIGGNAALTLQPSQLRLDAGQMITWVEGALAEPIEIVTPAGIAGIRGTTVFVNIEDDPNAPVEIFSWEGEVAFRLADSENEVVLTSGEQLFIYPGERDIEALSQQVQPLDRAAAQERLEGSPLINGFSSPLPTRPEIEATVDAL
ncbi:MULTISPECIES: FecR family protein [Cyanophyceae]|nr:FecR family protein [Nodosilinea sp. FACHB-141]MBD2111205.1 FecR domain-containing protein [Nodosilinea sp. FACHB-141]